MISLSSLIESYKSKERTLTEVENELENNNVTKVKNNFYEKTLNSLFSTDYTDLVRLFNAYKSSILISSTTQFYHLRVEENNVKASCKSMIQNYKYIFMYNSYIDCSELLYIWSPTEPYFPLLKYIQGSNPDNPIDYTYWLRRFNDLPIALKFLKQNSIKIEFTNRKDLEYLYKTIPEQYIKDFLSLLGSKSWYLDVIKDTDHFLDAVENWE